MTADLVVRIAPGAQGLADMAAAAAGRPLRLLLASMLEAQSAIYAVEDASRKMAGPASAVLRPHRWIGHVWQRHTQRPDGAGHRPRVSLGGEAFAVAVTDRSFVSLGQVAAELGECLSDHASRIVAVSFSAYAEVVAAEGPDRPEPKRTVLRHWRVMPYIDDPGPLGPMSLGDPAPDRPALLLAPPEAAGGPA